MADDDFILKEVVVTSHISLAQNNSQTDWKRKKQSKIKEQQNSGHDAAMFIKYSFKRDFRMNQFLIEPYKSPKILGDVFEAIIGAIFKDGGIESLLKVLKSLLAPFILFVAKYSKNIQKEPKEDFQQLST